MTDIEDVLFKGLDMLEKISIKAIDAAIQVEADVTMLKAQVAAAEAVMASREQEHLAATRAFEAAGVEADGREHADVVRELVATLKEQVAEAERRLAEEGRMRDAAVEAQVHLAKRLSRADAERTALARALDSRIAMAERLRAESLQRDPSDREGFATVLGDIVHNLRAVSSEAGAAAAQPVRAPSEERATAGDRLKLWQRLYDAVGAEDDWTTRQVVEKIEERLAAVRAPSEERDTLLDDVAAEFRDLRDVMRLEKNEKRTSGEWAEELHRVLWSYGIEKVAAVRAPERGADPARGIDVEPLRRWLSKGARDGDTYPIEQRQVVDILAMVDALRGRAPERGARDETVRAIPLSTTGPTLKWSEKDRAEARKLAEMRKGTPATTCWDCVQVLGLLDDIDTLLAGSTTGPANEHLQKAEQLLVDIIDSPELDVRVINLARVLDYIRAARSTTGPWDPPSHGQLARESLGNPARCVYVGGEGWVSRERVLELADGIRKGDPYPWRNVDDEGELLASSTTGPGEPTTDYEATAQKLLEALAYYGVHKVGCIHGPNSGYACDCGLGDLLLNPTEGSTTGPGDPMERVWDCNCGTTEIPEGAFCAGCGKSMPYEEGDEERLRPSEVSLLRRRVADLQRQLAGSTTGRPTEDRAIVELRGVCKDIDDTRIALGLDFGEKIQDELRDLHLSICKRIDRLRTKDTKETP